MGAGKAEDITAPHPPKKRGWHGEGEDVCETRTRLQGFGNCLHLYTCILGQCLDGDG